MMMYLQFYLFQRQMKALRMEVHLIRESYIQSAVDNEDGDIKDRVKTEGSVDCSKSRTYKIRYYVERMMQET